MTKFFEDFRVGEQTRLGEFTFDAEAIITFAREFDPQPFHIDEEGGRKSHFGGLCASGWHTCAVFMKVLTGYQSDVRERTELAEGERWPVPGPGLGFRDLRWTRPVYAGDTITFSRRVLEKIEMKSRPTWGLLINRNEGVNQHGERVISFIHELFIERRKMPGL